jgi:hypothetical protein
MITSEFALGNKANFVERIYWFLECRRFFETSCLTGSRCHFQSNVTPPVYEDSLTVLAGDLPGIAINSLTGLKVPALESKWDRFLTKFIISPDGDDALARASSFQSNRRPIQSDRKTDACSRCIDAPPDVDVVLPALHGSYRNLVPHLQPMFQYLNRLEIAQGRSGFYHEKT